MLDQSIVNLKCPAHRLLPWLGHGICDEDVGGCGRLFKHLLAENEDCSCGARLQPFGRLRVEALFLTLKGRGSLRAGSFTGRPMCAKCWEGRVGES